MNVLVAQQYGVGNAIMTTPLIRALHTGGHAISCSYDERRGGVKTVLGDLPEVKCVYGCANTAAIMNARFDVVIPCGRLPHLKERYRIPKMLTTFPEIPPKTSQHDSPSYFKKHEIEYLMDAARKLNYRGDTPHPYLGKVESAELDVAGPCVALGIGYHKGDSWSRLKHWGNVWFARLARELAAASITCFLVGGPSDRSDAQEIEKLAGHKLRNVTDQLSLRWMFGVLQACRCFVGNDTGLAHAAAALKKPTMTVFQQGVSSVVKNAPRGINAIHVVEPSHGNMYGSIFDWVLTTCGVAT